MPFSGTPESLLASTTAAFCSLMLVLYEGHVQVVFGDRATYSSVFHHKCGVSLVATTLWAAFERIMFPPAVLRERRRDREHRARLAAAPRLKRAAYPYARAAQTSARRPSADSQLRARPC